MNHHGILVSFYLIFYDKIIKIGEYIFKNDFDMRGRQLSFFVLSVWIKKT
jgi:hypothetical protein